MPGEMAHQRCPDPQSLVGVHNNESHFSLSGLDNDVAGPADYDAPAAFLQRGDQSHVLIEVDVREIGDLLLCERAFRRKKPAVERLRTASTDGCKELGAIGRLQSPNLGLSPVAQCLDRAVVAPLHCSQPPPENVATPDATEPRNPTRSRRAPQASATRQFHIKGAPS